MKFDFIVIGATGMQGRIVVRDLLENDYSVLLCGRDKRRIEHLLSIYKKTAFEYLDLNDKKRIYKIIKKSGSNVVINCAEGDWNLNVLETCINSNAHLIDLGSDIEMTKEQLSKNTMLKEKNLTHITGCGSVPGIGNVMLRYAAEKFDNISDVEVGFAWDSNIKRFVVPFSIQSIIEEFTSPAPIVSKRKVIKIKPLDSLVMCYHKAIGKENQFNVGHHPETYTMYNYCKNKGIKNVKFYAGFPEHSFNTINTLIEAGLGNKDEMEYKGIKIKPIEYLTEILKDLRIPEGYKEIENLWLTIKNKKKKINMECIVQSLKGWEDAGSNIDTGMPASIIAQMIKKGIIKTSGSYAPEDIVPVEPFFKELKRRYMFVYENGKLITTTL